MGAGDDGVPAGARRASENADDADRDIDAAADEAHARVDGLGDALNTVTGYLQESVPADHAKEMVPTAFAKDVVSTEFAGEILEHDRAQNRKEGLLTLAHAAQASGYTAREAAVMTSAYAANLTEVNEIDGDADQGEGIFAGPDDIAALDPLARDETEQTVDGYVAQAGTTETNGLGWEHYLAAGFVTKGEYDALAQTDMSPDELYGHLTTEFDDPADARDDVKEAVGDLYQDAGVYDGKPQAYSRAANTVDAVMTAERLREFLAE